jgi:hypothetical protein
MRLFVTEAMGLEPRPRDYIEKADGTRLRLFPRPHPLCLLVRDTPKFRSVVEHIGLSNASRSAAAPDLHGFYDTFGLAAAALRTHGYVGDRRGAGASLRAGGPTPGCGRPHEGQGRGLRAPLERLP